MNNSKSPSTRKQLYMMVYCTCLRAGESVDFSTMVAKEVVEKVDAGVFMLEQAVEAWEGVVLNTPVAPTRKYHKALVKPKSYQRFEPFG